jgi:hypothetical protein
MKPEQFLSKKILFGFCVLCLAVCSILYVFLKSEFGPQTSSAYVAAHEQLQATAEDAYHRFFVEHIDVFFKEEGINGMVDRTVNALADGQISMFVCHSLAHDIGHYAGYPDNYADIGKYISKENLDFCGSGFMHGVEAELANGPYPQNIDDLYRFCKLVLPQNPYYYGCYHGAGHSFMQQTQDPQAALLYCDQLRTNEVTNGSHCYRGVFSEHSNLVRQKGEDSEYLLVFCNSLDGSLQSYCAEELNGLELPATATEEEITIALKTCMAGGYGDLVETGCIKSVAGVAADRALGQGRVLRSVPYVLELPTALRQMYIRSSYEMFLKNALHHTDLSFEPFCDDFTAEDKVFCVTLSNS